MKHGICNLSVIPARSAPLDKSEMVTQLLYGDHFEVIAANESEEKKPDWIKIRLAYDNYECWVDRKQVAEISESEFGKLSDSSQTILSDRATILNLSDQSTLDLLPGSTLPFLNGTGFTIGNTGYQLQSKPDHQPGGIIDTGIRFLNVPYLWGGRSLFGIDCSGFVQIVFKINGIRLPRDAWEQAEVGKTLGFIDEAKAGDLAFFDNSEGRIVHVGIVLDEGKIIHASGKVRIDKLDHQGIFNVDTSSYSHMLRILRRVG